MKIVAEFKLFTNWICEKYNVNLLIIITYLSLA